MDHVADVASPDTATDASSHDATVDVPPIPDAGCSCSRVDAGFPLALGAIPLTCYCDMPSWPVTFTGRPACSTYETLLGCPDGGYPIYVETYTNCNLVKVAYGVFNAADFNVFDATTHELVGAMRADDYPSSFCGLDRVNGLEAGIVPGPECEVAKREYPCRLDGGDAQAPTNDADAGCACTTTDGGGGTGYQSLACYCASGNGLCPSYDEVRTSCPSGGAPGQFNRLDVHGACNLVVMTTSARFDGETHVFDATTHELVGASRFTDVNVLPCGSERVFGYRAGVFPPADCPVSQSINRCPGDAGGSPEGGGPNDAGCPCTPGDAGMHDPGVVPLDCYCSSLGRCPRSYDDALWRCGDGLPGLSWLEEYPACNLSVITIGYGFYGERYAYDYTTRALVGAEEGADIANDICGSTTVNGYRAGVLPDPSCVRSRAVACTRDADAGPRDAMTDGD